jgi:hypothetical protein
VLKLGRAELRSGDWGYRYATPMAPSQDAALDFPEELLGEPTPDPEPELELVEGAVGSRS